MKYAIPMIYNTRPMIPKNEKQDISLIPVTGLLGSGIQQSLSPLLHEAAGETTGRMTDYHLFDIAPKNVDGFLKQVIEFGEVAGFNVTIPYKEVMFGRIEAVHEEAKAVGAVNTIAVRGEHLFGYNTDKPAFSRSIIASLKEGDHPENGWKVIVLGAGGGARAVVRSVLDLGIADELDIMSRSEDRRVCLLLAIQEECDQKGIKLTQHDWLDWEKLEPAKRTMIINATPLGMADKNGIILRPSVKIPDGLLYGSDLVFDLNYNPPITGLMEVAREVGLQAVGGGGLLIEQAVLSRSIWFGDGREDEERATMVAVYSTWASKLARNNFDGNSGEDL